MDLLHTCYRSYMRLYPDDPDRLTLGRWVWCPPGALDLPFDTVFQSSKWDPFSWRVDPDVGEVRGLAGYSSGKITPRFTGRTFCGAAELYQQGSPLALAGTPAVDEDGVPICCAAPPAVGGLAMLGAGSAISWADSALWLRPESLDDLVDGQPLPSWPDTVIDGLDWTPNNVPAVKQTDPLSGLPIVVFPPGSALNRPTPISLTQATIYLVGSGVSPPGDGHAGPWLVGGAIGTGRTLTVNTAAVAFRSAGFALSAGYPQTVVGRHLYRARVEPAASDIAVDGARLAAVPSGPGGTFFASSLITVIITLPQTRTSWTGELLIYDRALTGVEDAAITHYLLQKWNIPDAGADVITGSIVAYGGATVPPGYLACDGSAVSRSTYADLFTAIGTTWGPGDGSTTFNLPDLRGRAGIGAGTGPGLSPRVLAATGGEELHTLTTGELANHVHTVTDPGHAHQSGDLLNFITDDGTVINTGGAGAGGATTPTTNFATTGITGTDAAGGGGGHNNMQPFGVVLYLVKA